MKIERDAMTDSNTTELFTDDEPPSGTFQVSHDNGRTFSVPVEILAEPKSPESASESRWHELFGTPERAARTLAGIACDDGGCEGCSLYGANCSYDSNALLEWLRGDA